MKSIKHSCLWSFICIINSTFGYIFALSQSFSPLPMLLAIFCFLIFFILFPQTHRYQSIRNNSILFRSLIIGYFINSIIIPAHFIIGCFSVQIVSSGSKILPDLITPAIAVANFAQIFFTTIIMGLLLNIMALIISAVIYFIQKFAAKIFVFSNIYSSNQLNQ